jgi:predicted metal-dependent HD superfamily phosphohydrolase
MKQAWAALGASGGESLQTALLARYAEPHRAYHSRRHLDECLALFREFAHLAERPAEIEIALWFHDAIYDVHRHDNEALSADWARTAMLEAGAPADAAERVAALVLATRHSVAPATPDERLLVDIDLAILGAAPARFAEYEAQIRIEYAHVHSTSSTTSAAPSWPAFSPGRCCTPHRPCASASRRPRGPIFRRP